MLVGSLVEQHVWLHSCLCFSLFWKTVFKKSRQLLDTSRLGVSNRNRDPTHPPNPSDSAREPADSTPMMVGGGSLPLEPENSGSVGEFSPQNLKKPDRTKIWPSLSLTICSSLMSSLRRCCSLSILASPSSISTSSSLICALRRRRSLFVLNVPSSPSPPSLRFVFTFLKFSSLRFGYLWNCCLLLFLFFGFVDLFFGFVDLLFRFEDLLILFFKNRSSVFDLCILVEIKADRCPPEPDPTRPVAFGSWWWVWNFSTRSDRVGCGLGTNLTRTDPWTALLSIARLSIEPLELSFSIAIINFNPSRFLRIRLDSFLTDFQSIEEVSVCLIDAR